MIIRFGIVLIVCAWTSSTWSEDKKSTPSLDGTWIPTSAELGGKMFPEEIRKTIQLVIHDKSYTVTLGKQVDKGTLRWKDTAKPKEMDITGTEGPNKDKTIQAIYEQDGDTLKICYDLSGKSRPTEFKSKEGTQLFLATYTKQKK